MSKTASELAHEIAQECVSKTPVIILGSGASAAYGIPGMPQLREHLLKIGAPGLLASSDEKQWSHFIESLKKNDLETALNEVRLSENLTAYVVLSTWDYLVPHDFKVFEQLLTNRDLFPLSALFTHLFRTTSTELHVVTPNYDRLAEYAAEAANFIHFTGFSYGYLRSRVTNGHRITFNRAPVRKVNVWKVHGSFDWFRDSENVVVGLPITHTRPKGMTPVIVTPGIEKYRLTHDEPFHSIKTEADKALQTAESYFFVGYGFNDAHLQTTLVERCRVKRVPLVLLSKQITASAHNFFKSGRCGKFIAIEEAGDGCKIYCQEYPSGEVIPGMPYWKLDKFLTLITV